MSNTNKYMLSQASEQDELNRLQLLEEMLDENSKSFLLKAGLKQGMRVMEIGPGAGSILQWMSETIELEGISYGVDLNPRFVKHLESESIRIIESRIEDMELKKNSFDLIHARFIFVHVQDSLNAISKVLNLLKPGGVFVLEEPDLISAKILRGPLQNEASKKLQKACTIFMEKMGLNPSYGAYAAAEMVGCGFIIDNIEHNNFVFENGSKYKIYEEDNLKKDIWELVIETGEVSRKDINIFFKDDPNVIGTSYTIFSITGRKTI